MEDRQIVVERFVKASPELVYRVWIDPDKRSAWWGPNGFTTTMKSTDFSVGGIWVYTMHGPDGTDYPNYNKYLEIIPEKLIRYEHGAHLEEGPMFESEITFTGVEGGTLIRLTATFPSEEIRTQHMSFGAVEGGKQTLSRLAEIVDEA